MKPTELVFIPGAQLSHIVAAVETAKLLVERAEHLSITVLIMNPFKDITVDTYTSKIASSNRRLRLVDLPGPDGPPTPSPTFVFDYVDSRVAHVREIVSRIVENPSSEPAGLVLDLFTTNFIDVANEFGLPSYVFSTCGACYVGMSLKLISDIMSPDSGDIHLLESGADFELSVPYFSVPVPSKVLPGRNCNKEDPTSKIMLKCLMRLSEVKGILVNSFHELESYAIDSLMADVKGPKIYAVGPVLNSSSAGEDEDDDVMKWLDTQPEKSVIFLSFGTMASLDEAQVREIALALEKCGYGFLWCLRNPVIPGVAAQPHQKLPEGFLERSKGIGKVVEWAPQQAVLAHAAVGGFVSHCGWNSTLESVWYGVPMAAFPMFAEQHLNAFQLVTELGVAEAITFDYQMDFTGEKQPKIAGWEEIAAALRRVMAAEGVREKVKELQKKAREGFEEGGSSYKAQGLFIEDVMRNINVA